MNFTKSEPHIPERRHKPGSLESSKFEGRRSGYYQYIEELQELEYEFVDFLHYFPCFVGDMTLSRMLALYEGYKLTTGINGHIADVGMFRGASSFLFAKLVKIFEPNSLVQVHGFDWFNGNQPEIWEENIKPDAGKESYERVKRLSLLQDLDDTLKVHKVDLTKEIDAFFEMHKHLRFKLIFMDAGQYAVVRSALPHFWSRLAKGGVIIFDQYNFDVAPGETMAVDEVLGELDVQINAFPFTWMPTAYIVK